MTSPTRADVLAAVAEKQEDAVYAKAISLLEFAEAHGLVVTIHLEPQKPLAMRNYKPVIEITEKR